VVWPVVFGFAVEAPEVPEAPRPGARRPGIERIELTRHEVAKDGDEGVKLALTDVDLKTLDGKNVSLSDFRENALLIVNVASECGLTPQYAALQSLQERFGEKGFKVLGFPCNQFGSQEPGTSSQIEEFCTTNFGVTFPMFEKIEVKGPGQHPLYRQLSEYPDEEGRGGDVEWNFEKFLVAPHLEVVGRYRPIREPESNTIVAAIKSVLPE
jgi:glutathione peroxidase